ncbi:MAG: hypothetical protein LUB61_06965, partial [Eggerthellaceae bacterium]|nr:hypothetical protein [Eggerthellaceae bacterium]
VLLILIAVLIVLAAVPAYTYFQDTIGAAQAQREAESIEELHEGNGNIIYTYSLPGSAQKHVI